MNAPSRVLIVETQSYPGGMWHYACCLSRAVATAGFELVLVATDPFELLDGFGDLRVQSLGPRIAPTRPRAVFLTRRLINQANKFRRLLRLMREFRPNIVHLNSPTGKLDFLYIRYLRTLGARVVFTAHEPDPDTGVDWFDWARYRAADAIFVHSLKSLEAVTAGGIDGSKIARIHHGAYLDLCPPPNISSDEAKRSLGLPPDAQVVLFFGGILPYKGLDILIKAFAKLTDEIPNAYLVIAGEPQEVFAQYKSEIEELSIADRVILDLRYIPFAEFPRYFCAADVVALPYRRIQQSGALQLAYAYSRPVVAANVGDLGEKVTEDRTGIVARAEDPEAFAFAIREALANKTVAEEMGKRGRFLAETKYSWSAVAKRTAEVYRAICNRNSDHGNLPKRAR